jgi:hypothetical protein
MAGLAADRKGGGLPTQALPRQVCAKIAQSGRIRQ